MSVARRAVVGGAASLVVVGSSVGWYAASAPAHAPSSLVVDDTAGILHEPTLREAVEDVRFHAPTDVAVFTHRGGEAALTDDFALNDAVLTHARESRNEWLSGNEQKWADDLYLFAVDPEGRLVGTYFGENRKVGEDTQLDIQEATKDDLRVGQWTEGSVVGVQAAAERMNAPAIRTGGGMAVAGGASAVTLLGAAGYLGVGASRARKSREARAEGDRAMANVVRDDEVTELHARLIPEDTRYGGLMLRRYDEYRTGFRELTELGNEVRAIKEKDYDSKEVLARLTAYREKATSLDHLDDVIADTAALLNRDRAWLDAWQRQVGPVREDLEQVGPLIDDDLDEKLRDLPEVAALRSYASQALADLDRVRGDLEHERMSPDAALDHLRHTRDGLTQRLDALAAAAVRELTEDEFERELMEREMREERAERRLEHSILYHSHPGWSWYAVPTFRAGYTTGMEGVEQSRAQSSSSSGSTSGFSSGGSFSGAGSSSRF